MKKIPSSPLGDTQIANQSQLPVRPQSDGKKRPTLLDPGERFDSGRSSAPVLTSKGLRPSPRGSGSEKNERNGLPGRQAQTEQAERPTALTTPPGPLPQPTAKGGARYVLDSAKEPGIYFQQDQKREGHSEDDEDPELRAAVEECISMLFGVRGIHDIGPGKNEFGEPVVVIAVGPGFGESSFIRIPAEVGRFKTLLALPFEQLPLRRDRPPGG